MATVDLPEQPGRLDQALAGHHGGSTAFRARTTASTATSSASPPATPTPSTSGTPTPPPGIPSKGLLQVIQPTFDAYHVPGTSSNIYDPVANITAACNYACHVYGSIDNVNCAY